jgi:hypothetical protein
MPTSRQREKDQMSLIREQVTQRWRDEEDRDDYSRCQPEDEHREQIARHSNDYVGRRYAL